MPAPPPAAPTAPAVAAINLWPAAGSPAALGAPVALPYRMLAGPQTALVAGSRAIFLVRFLFHPLPYPTATHIEYYPRQCTRRIRRSKRPDTTAQTLPLF